jgi:hypothetical protein
MGHTENKCAVRYDMENDDGVRAWSNDLRAEPRRQGGRQTSRWLKEDYGVGGRSSGGGNPLQGENAVPTRMGPTRPHESAETSNNAQSYHSATATNETQVLQPVQSLIHSHPPKSNRPITTTTLMTSADKPSLANQFQLPNNNPPDIQLLPINSQISSPSVTTFQFKSTNHNIKTTLSPHHYFPLPSVSTQFTNFVPPIKDLVPSNQQTWTHHNTNLNHIPPKAQNEPNPSQYATQAVNPPLDSPTNTPTHTEQGKNNNETLKGVADMEVQLERKRRREEKLEEKKEQSGLHKHFLSAGPGSQDCRDQ